MWLFHIDNLFIVLLEETAIYIIDFKTFAVHVCKDRLVKIIFLLFYRNLFYHLSKTYTYQTTPLSYLFSELFYKVHISSIAWFSLVRDVPCP